MSVRVLTIVWDTSPSEGGDLLVELALADQAGDDGVTWMQVERLSQKTRLSERHIYRTLESLTAAGRIEVRKAQHGRRRISVYRVLGPGLRPVDYDRLPFKLDSSFGGGPDSLSPDTVSGRKARRHDTGVSDDMTRASATRARSSSLEPSLNRSGAAAVPRPRDPVWDALTEIFGEAATHGAKSLRGKITKSLREAGATAEDIHDRAKRYKEVMPVGTTLTETALEKHWPLCAPRRKSVIKPCAECGVGGNMHAADCSKVQAGVA